MKNANQILLTLGLVLLILGMTGCLSVDDVDGKDNSQQSYSVTARIPFESLRELSKVEIGRAKSSPQDQSRNSRPGAALEIHLSSSQGEFTDTPDFGGFRIGDEFHSGGQEVEFDYRFHKVMVGIHHHKKFGRGFRIGGTYGLGLAQFTIEGKSASNSSKDRFDDLGPTIAGQLDWEFINHFSITTELRSHIGFGLNNSVMTGTWSGAAGLRLSPSDNFELFGLYRRSYYEFEELASSYTDSEVELNSSGLEFGLLITF